MAAVFTKGFPKPVWFVYQNNKVTIKEIVYQWTERSGSWLNYKYTVTEGISIFEIVFLAETMEWQLEAIHEGGFEGVI